MDDKELDMLIRESFERNEMLETINRNVMKAVNRSERSNTRAMVLRMAAVAFGVPAVIALYVWAASTLGAATQADVMLQASLAIGGMMLVASLIVAVRIFLRDICNNNASRLSYQ